MDQKTVSLARRIENASRKIAEKLKLPYHVSFCFYYNDKNRVIGMDVATSVEDKGEKIPKILNWHPKAVESSFLPLLEKLANAT